MSKLTIEEYQKFVADEAAYQNERVAKLQKQLEEYGFIFDKEMVRDLLLIISEFIETE